VVLVLGLLALVFASSSPASVVVYDGTPGVVATALDRYLLDSNGHAWEAVAAEGGSRSSPPAGTSLPTS
jgi:hypothetical protein